MSEFKGTPGPWVVEEYGASNNHVVGFGPVVFASKAASGKYRPSREEMKANALAAAAAPDLLEALIGIIDSIGPDGYIPSCGLPKTQAARAAIAKALGDQK